MIRTVVVPSHFPFSSWLGRLCVLACFLTVVACPGPLPDLVDPLAGEAAKCGDGIVNQTEETCDDGNTVNEDSCTNSCEAAVCGDGIKRSDLGLGAPGFEACDDGNQEQTDACRNDCYANVCGDGFVYGGIEECDDGNQVDTDACRNTCDEAVCGDNVVQDGVEECDDGNVINEDACISTCMLATCGDGFVRAGLEACDDGNDVETDACLGTCLNARCGDTIVRLDVAVGNPGYEACDDGNQDRADACLPDCTAARCGDEIIRQDLEQGAEGYEECDDGNDVDRDECTTECQTARCGDGIVRQDLNEGVVGYEECEDGNDVDDDDCANNCFANICGNGRVDVGEECDDNNQDNNDGCVEGCRAARCGDGFLRAGGEEECDDGNDSDLDACTAECLIYPNGDSQQNAIVNCTDHKLHYPDATNGPIWATKPNGDVFQSYCDFTTDEANGPWTRCMILGPGADGYERNRFNDCKDWGATKALLVAYRTSHRVDEGLENAAKSEIVRLSQTPSGINNLFTLTNGENDNWRLASANYDVTDLGGDFPARNHNNRVYVDWNGLAYCTEIDLRPLRYVAPLGMRAELCIGGEQIPYPDAYLTCPHPDTQQLFCISSTSFHANQGMSFAGTNQGAWTFTAFVNAGNE